nr:hypothetical protein CparaKRNrm1_p061 [Cryptomonas paramecium]
MYTDMQIFDFVFFSAIVLSCFFMIFKIDSKWKFCKDRIIFCPSLGSVHRCNFVSLTNCMFAFSYIFFALESVCVKISHKSSELICKNKTFLFKLQFLSWAIFSFFFLRWTNEVEADANEIFKKMQLILNSVGIIFNCINIYLIENNKETFYVK